MFNFFIIMDENLGNTIARHFSSKYLNYTINFIISKEFPSFSDFPDFSLVLCDLDQNIELAKNIIFQPSHFLTKIISRKL